METSNHPKLQTILTAATASVFLLRIAKDLIPNPLQDHLYSLFRKSLTRFSSHITVVIEEFDGLTPNHMFQAANFYLGTNLSPRTTRIKVNKPEKEKELLVSIDRDQELVEFFQGVKLNWLLVSRDSEKPVHFDTKKRNNGAFLRSEVRYFELSFKKKHKDMVLSSYLPYILDKAKAIKEEKKTLKLHTIDYHGTDYWGSINFDHPATFDTVAMDTEMKEQLIEDLDLFIERKEFYREVGKAWKRGYLLYGPPGTGKSSLIAAMANYLNFDVYDLDLKELQCNSDLRRLLIGTGNRSILVVEDIDLSFESTEDNKVTLSGLLNFIDGLWSSCGDERIIVFTTNHKDQLDPALLRPGRMDLHLHMSYCSFVGFKTLASNYLKIQEHHLFREIEQLLEKKLQVTPAEIAGELMKHKDAGIALEGLIKFLQNKMR
ncbi:P-loop containing nucleoside triphosphate hydrolases superfamily protein [Euphorbia peplus]|nr:P-loop containing nucleoside triphosphate hydrolases superfamily protein [Euphorbia peplus]